MSENNKVFFIVNKYAGAGYRDSVEGRILSACDRLNLNCTIEFTQEKGHATELARRAVQEQFHQVYAVGGDGTVNETAQGLLGSTVGMGILPKGSGNGLARHLGIPTRFSSALRLLQSSSVVDIDTVKVNDKLSVNVSGIGFDAHVAQMFGGKGRRGLAGYVRLVLREFGKYREFGADVTLDQQKRSTTTFMISFANSSQFGNNAKVAPAASVCDGLIDVCLVRKVPISQILGFAGKMFSGKIDRSRYVDIHTARRARVVLPHPIPFHIDGEPQQPASAFDIEVVPRSLRVLVPAWGVENHI